MRLVRRVRDRRVPPVGVLAATLAGAWALGCGAAGEPVVRTDLVALPTLDLEGAEPVVRSALEARRARVEDLLERGSEISDDRLGAAYGDLARHYHAYELGAAAEIAYRNAATLQPAEPQWPHALGLLAQGEGRLELAAESFRRAEELGAGDPAVRLRLAECLLGLGRLEEARSLFREVLDESSPDHAPAARHGLARVAIEEGDDAAARALLEELLRERPEAGAARYRLAQVHRRLGDLDRAESLLAEGSQGTIEFPDPFAAAIEELAAGPAALLRRANRLLMERQLPASEELFRRVLTQDPQSVSALRNLAVVQRERGKGDEAIATLERAVELEASDAGLQADLAAAYLASGRVAEAVDGFGRALALEPTLQSARFGLANALIAQERWSEARRELERVLAEDPGDRRARYQLAMTKLRAGRAEEASRELQELVREAPDFAPARLGLASILLQERDLEGARRHLRVAAERSSDPTERANASLQLAQLALRERDYRGARAHFEAAHRATPTAATTHALARLLATAPEPAARDGFQALTLARAAYSAQRSLEHAETIGMAMAESGDLAGAAQWVEGLLVQARTLGRPELVRRLEADLARYRRGEPKRIGDARR